MRLGCRKISLQKALHLCLVSHHLHCVVGLSEPVDTRWRVYRRLLNLCRVRLFKVTWYSLYLNMACSVSHFLAQHVCTNR